MPSVCLYLQLHQPYRLRRYSVFDTDRHYFDDFKNADLLHTVARRCYLPAGGLLLDLVKQHRGAFKFALGVSGVLLDQLQARVPEVLDDFRKLAASGCVEFVCQTYYHSLTFLTSRAEYRSQIEMHRDRVARLVGQVPRTFHNTEWVYSNDVAAVAAEMGFEVLLMDGDDATLAARTPNALYTPPGQERLRLLPRNDRLSDDIALHFGDKYWPGYPLTPEAFARRVAQIESGPRHNGSVCNLFLDYETFGEHQWKETGIFEFLAGLPRALLVLPETDFLTPAQAAQVHPSAGVLDVPEPGAATGTGPGGGHDLSPWLGNAMQANAMQEWQRLQEPLLARHDPGLLDDWRKLGTSDHFYYMSTKFWAEGQVHKYYSPYESPYDAYINFMNVLDNIKSRVTGV
jgi:alpha-amylase